MTHATVNTARGPVRTRELGRMLMHEHLLIGFAGWESDSGACGPNSEDLVRICVDNVVELQEGGISSLLDPCPIDLGRNVELMGEVAARTNFNIVFATGLYHEGAAAPYWRMKFALDPDAEQKIADLFIQELTEGVGSSGLKAGVIKVGTASPPFSNYERAVFRAAARASLATDAPITTHSDAILGDEQAAYLISLGIPPHRIIVGHSCGNSDPEYHLAIAEKGAYVGFDRFGMTAVQSDEVRIDRLVSFVRSGFERQVVLSHDCAWCMRGQMMPKQLAAEYAVPDGSMHISRNILPLLITAGLDASHIDTMLVDNPRRYFADEQPVPPMAGSLGGSMPLRRD